MATSGWISIRINYVHKNSRGPLTALQHLTTVLFRFETTKNSRILQKNVFGYKMAEYCYDAQNLPDVTVS